MSLPSYLNGDSLPPNVVEIIKNHHLISVVSVLLIFMIAQIVVAELSIHSNICNHDPFVDEWIYYFISSTTGANVILCIISIIASINRYEEESSFLFTFISMTNILNLISNILVLSNIGGVCIDALGVHTFGPQWIPFIINQLFLLYMAYGLNDISTIDLPTKLTKYRIHVFMYFFFLFFCFPFYTEAPMGLAIFIAVICSSYFIYLVLDLFGLMSVKSLSTFAMFMNKLRKKCMLKSSSYYNHNISNNIKLNRESMRQLQDVMKKRLIKQIKKQKEEEKQRKADEAENNNNNINTIKNIMTEGDQNIKYFLIWFIRIGLLRYPLFYLFGSVNIYNNNATLFLQVLFNFMDVVVMTLCLFISHTTSRYQAFTKLQEEIIATIKRRSHLRMVFHDVRGPLSNVIMGLELLFSNEQFVKLFAVNNENDDDSNFDIENAGVDLDTVETLEDMKVAAEDCMSTLNHCLDMEKIESEATAKLLLNEFEVRQLVEKVKKQYQITARKKNITITTEVKQGVALSLIGDQFKIQHVLMNLLSNSIKYSPPYTTVTIRVVSSPIDPPDSPRQTEESLDKNRFRMFQRRDTAHQILTTRPPSPTRSSGSTTQCFITGMQLRNYSDMNVQGTNPAYAQQLYTQPPQPSSSSSPRTPAKTPNGSGSFASGFQSFVTKGINTINSLSKSAETVAVPSNHNTNYSTTNHNSNINNYYLGDRTENEAEFSPQPEFNYRRGSRDSRCGSIPAEWVNVTFSVIDQGQGISPAEQLKLFQPFMQGKHKIKQTVESTGLGLAQCKRNVELHNGEIGCTSTQDGPNHGTIFWFSVPFEVSEPDHRRRSVFKRIPMERIIFHADNILEEMPHTENADFRSATNEPSDRVAAMLLNDTHRSKASNDSRNNHHQIIDGNNSSNHHNSNHHTTTTTTTTTINRGGNTNNNHNNNNNNNTIGDVTRLCRSGSDASAASSVSHSSSLPSLDSALMRGSDTVKGCSGGGCSAGGGESHSSGQSVTPQVSDRPSSVEQYTSRSTTSNPLDTGRTHESFQPSISSGGCSQFSQQLTVLLVDDEHMAKKLLKNFLKKRNVYVETADNGRLALEVYHKYPRDHFQVIFTDGHMPEMDGLQLCSKLRADRYPHMLVGLTGDSFEEELNKFLYNGADLVVSKPLDPKKLDGLVAHIEANGYLHNQDKKYVFIGNIIRLKVLDPNILRRSRSSSSVESDQSNYQQLSTATSPTSRAPGEAISPGGRCSGRQQLQQAGLLLLPSPVVTSRSQISNISSNINDEMNNNNNNNNNSSKSAFGRLTRSFQTGSIDSQLPLQQSEYFIGSHENDPSSSSSSLSYIYVSSKSQKQAISSSPPSSSSSSQKSWSKSFRPFSRSPTDKGSANSSANMNTNTNVGINDRFGISAASLEESTSSHSLDSIHYQYTTITGSSSGSGSSGSGTGEGTVRGAITGGGSPLNRRRSASSNNVDNMSIGSVYDAQPPQYDAIPRSSSKLRHSGGGIISISSGSGSSGSILNGRNGITSSGNRLAYGSGSSDNNGYLKASSDKSVDHPGRNNKQSITSMTRSSGSSGGSGGNPIFQNNRRRPSYAPSSFSAISNQDVDEKEEKLTSIVGKDAIDGSNSNNNNSSPNSNHMNDGSSRNSTVSTATTTDNNNSSNMMQSNRLFSNSLEKKVVAHLEGTVESRGSSLQFPDSRKKLLLGGGGDENKRGSYSSSSRVEKDIRVALQRVESGVPYYGNGDDERDDNGKDQQYSSFIPTTVYELERVNSSETDENDNDDRGFKTIGSPLTPYSPNKPL